MQPGGNRIWSGAVACEVSPCARPRDSDELGQQINTEQVSKDRPGPFRYRAVGKRVIRMYEHFDPGAAISLVAALGFGERLSSHPRSGGLLENGADGRNVQSLNGLETRWQQPEQLRRAEEAHRLPRRRRMIQRLINGPQTDSGHAPNSIHISFRAACRSKAAKSRGSLWAGRGVHGDAEFVARGNDLQE